MKERYISAVADREFVDRLIGNSINLVGRIYGKIYFPTFSNSLKEVGRYLSGLGHRLRALPRHYCGGPGNSARTMGSSVNWSATTWTTAERPQLSGMRLIRHRL